MRKVILYFICLSVYSWETDNFTSRNKILRAGETEKTNNLYKLNDKMNKELHAVIKMANETFDCTKDVEKMKNKQVPLLFQWIDDSLGGTHAVIEKFAEEGGAKLYDHNVSQNRILGTIGDAFTRNNNIYNKVYSLQGAFNLNDMS
jgi:hypothetical protein